MALRAVEHHAGRRVADPVHDAAQEHAFFLELQDLIEHLPVDEPEIGRAGLDLDAAQIREQPVVEPRREALEEWNGGRIAAQRVHDLVTVLPTLHELRDDLGRMLEVRVHRDHGFAARRREAGEQRVLVAEVARQAHAADSRVALAEPHDRVPRAVRAAVIHDHELPVDAELVELAEQARVEDVEIAFLVVRWYDDRNHDAPLELRRTLTTIPGVRSPRPRG